MKKLIVCLLITLGILSSVFAQKPSFGFKGGLNFISLSEETTEEDATGFHAGLVFHAPIKKYGVMVEAIYSREGSEDLKLDYINVPIMVTYKIIPGLRAHLGPQFKVNVNANSEIDSSSLEDAGLDVDVSFDESIEEDIKDLNFDGVAGLEYKFPVIGIFAQARYVFGLGDLGDNNGIKQNIFQLSVGYRF